MLHYFLKECILELFYHYGTTTTKIIFLLIKILHSHTWKFRTHKQGKNKQKKFKSPPVLLQETATISVLLCPIILLVLYLKRCHIYRMPMEMWRNATPNSRHRAHNPDPSQLRSDIHLGDHESSRDGSMFQSEPVRLLGLPKRKFTPPNRLGAMCGSHLWPEKATLYENGANALKVEPRNKEKLNSNLSPEVNWAWSQPYPRTIGFGKPIYLVSL